MNKLMLLAPEIYNIAAKKGFWSVSSNFKEKLMLIISELSEAVEADRNCKHAYLQEFETIWKREDQTTMLETIEARIRYVEAFEINIKDSVADELADALIRMLDFIHGTGTTLNPGRSFPAPALPTNFAEACLEVIKRIVEIEVSYDMEVKVQRLWSEAFSLILALCRRYNIDVYRHIKLKMLYNQTRKHKHGKAY